MYYAFTPNSVFKSVPPNGSDSDTVPEIYVNKTICNLPFYKIQVNHFMAEDKSFGAKFIQKYILWVRGLVSFQVLRHSFLSLTDCWWLYNIQLKTSRGYSALFWCLCQKLSLSPLYSNKTLLHKSSERSSLSLAPDWILLLQGPRIPAL